jgi:hypothetical protein
MDLELAYFQTKPAGWWWLEPWNFSWLSFWKVGNFILPTDELTPSFFRGVGFNHQPDINIGKHAKKTIENCHRKFVDLPS